MKPNKIVRLFSITVLLLFSFKMFAQPSVLDKKISIQVKNQSVSYVLSEIQTLAHVNFIYMSGLFDKSKRVSISLKNTSVKIILQTVISNRDILLYVVDNKIVFCKKDDVPAGVKTEKVALNQDIVPKANKQQPVVVKVFDTTKITIFDTLKVTFVDTIHVYDTVKKYIEKNNPKSVDFSTHLPLQTIVSWFVGLSSCSNIYKSGDEPILKSLMQKSESSKYAIQLGIGAEFCKKHFCFNSGISYAISTAKIEYQLQKITTNTYISGYDSSSYWQVKLVNYQPNKPPSQGGNQPPPGTYYDSTLIATKTPVYKTDTNYVPVNYKGQNLQAYIHIPFLVLYRYVFYKNIIMQIGTGFDLALLLQSNGKIALSSSELINKKDCLRDYYMSSFSQVSIGCRFLKRHFVNIKTSFSYSLTPIYKNNYPLHIKENEKAIWIAYGIDIGK